MRFGLVGPLAVTKGRGRAYINLIFVVVASCLGRWGHTGGEGRAYISLIFAVVAAWLGRGRAPGRGEG